MMSKHRFYAKHAINRIDRYIYPSIAYWMNRTGRSATMLAEEIGVTHTTLCMYMTGRREPKMFFILDILRITGMTFEEAFRRREE